MVIVTIQLDDQKREQFLAATITFTPAKGSSDVSLAALRDESGMVFRIVNPKYIMRIEAL